MLLDLSPDGRELPEDNGFRPARAPRAARRPKRSAMTPPKSVKKRKGMEPANPTTPSQKAEFRVSRSTSQPWATFCIQVPMLERKFPLQKRRKLGLRRARAS